GTRARGGRSGAGRRRGGPARARRGRPATPGWRPARPRRAGRRTGRGTCLLVVARPQVGPEHGDLPALAVVAAERVDVLLLLQERADERDVLLELLLGDARAEERADPVDQLGGGGLLAQLWLLAQPVELDQHLVEELRLQMGVVHGDDLPHGRDVGE